MSLRDLPDPLCPTCGGVGGSVGEDGGGRGHALGGGAGGEIVRTECSLRERTRSLSPPNRLRSLSPPAPLLRRGGSAGGHVLPLIYICICYIYIYVIYIPPQQIYRGWTSTASYIYIYI